MRRYAGSSHHLFDPVRLLRPSQPHSTALPSPKRYDKRYDVRFLSEEEPNHRRFTYKGGKQCMLASTKLVADFSRGCAHPAMQPPIPTTHPHPAARKNRSPANGTPARRGSRRRHDTQSDGEAAEPGHRVPAMRRRVTVGEQQWQEHQDQAEPGGPDPLPEPGRFRSAWESAGIGEERIDCVLVCGVHEPIEEADGQEDPAYGVFGAVRADQSPDDRERHYQGGEDGD